MYFAKNALFHAIPGKVRQTHEATQISPGSVSSNASLDHVSDETDNFRFADDTCGTPTATSAHIAYGHVNGRLPWA
jgi:hypothetical protein